MNFLFRVLFLFLSFSIFNTASANDLIQRTINNILQKEKQRSFHEKAKNNNIKNIFVNPKKLVVSKSNNNSGKCLKINNIDVVNQTVLIDQVKKYVNNNIKGKCNTGIDISNALNSISNIYIEYGYITSRAFVEAQNLNSGSLKITIVEGKLSSINLSGEKNTSSKINAAFPKHRGELLNLRMLEQGLEQINRLPSNQIGMSVKPSNEVGGSTIVLENTKSKAWRVGISSDNFGSESMGKLQTSISLGLDNLLGVNDQLNLSINQNNEFSSTKGGRGNSVGFSFPKGYWLYSLGLSTHKYAQVVTTPLSQFSTSGKSNTSYFEAKKTFKRHKLGKSEVNFKISKKIVSNYLEDTKINVSSYDLTTFVVGLKNTKLLKNSTLVSELKIHKGLNIFGADDDNDRFYQDEPEAQFNKITIDLDYSKAFEFKKLSLNYRGQLSAQLASDYLHSTEQFSVGGLYTVRGYESYSDSSSRGLLIRNEVDFSKYSINKAFRYNPYLALDLGHVNKRERKSTTLIGSAVGIRGFYKKTNFDLSLNQALKSIEGNKFTNDPFLLGKLSINF